MTEDERPGWGLLPQAGYLDSADKQSTTRAAKFGSSFNQAVQCCFMSSPCLPNTIIYPLGPGPVHLFSYKRNIRPGPITLLPHLGTITHCTRKTPAPPTLPLPCLPLPHLPASPLPQLLPSSVSGPYSTPAPTTPSSLPPHSYFPLHLVLPASPPGYVSPVLGNWYRFPIRVCNRSRGLEVSRPTKRTLKM